MPKILSLINYKGGVGKTSTTIHLGAALTWAGKKILLCDLNPHHDLHHALGIFPPTQPPSTNLKKLIQPTSLPNLYLLNLSWTKSQPNPQIAKNLQNFRYSFDYLILDLPPHIEKLHQLAIQVSQEILIPIQCRGKAFQCTQEILLDLHQLATHYNPNLQLKGILLTMFTTECSLCLQEVQKIHQKFSNLLFHTFIPEDPLLPKTTIQGLTLLEYNPTSYLSFSYLELAREFLQRPTTPILQLPFFPPTPPQTPPPSPHTTKPIPLLPPPKPLPQLLPRIPEPEVMDTPQDAQEYDHMDFHEVNQNFAQETLPLLPPNAKILDAGTATARIPILIAQSQPNVHIEAVDLSENMLQLAEKNVKNSGLEKQITLKKMDIKNLHYPNHSFDVVISNTTIHHLPNPLPFLQEIQRILKPNGSLFLRDLLRPPDQPTLEKLVQTYAKNTTPYQKTLFHNSLLASFTLEEIQYLLCQAQLNVDQLYINSDRHWSAKRYPNQP